MSVKQLRHAQKMARKRAQKAERRAKYAALAGSSKRKKRQKNNGSGPTAQRGCHAMADCGNVGCKRCYPRENRDSLNGKTHIRKVAA